MSLQGVQGVVERDLIYLNDAATSVYNGMVGKQYDGVGTLAANTKYEDSVVADIICLYIYGATQTRLKNHFPLHSASCGVIYLRKSRRNAIIPFQVSKKKRLGKMVFTYDRELVEKHFKSLPKELQQLTDGVIREDRLEIKTKITKQEMWY